MRPAPASPSSTRASGSTWRHALEYPLVRSCLRRRRTSPAGSSSQQPTGQWWTPRQPWEPTSWRAPSSSPHRFGPTYGPMDRGRRPRERSARISRRDGLRSGVRSLLLLRGAAALDRARSASLDGIADRGSLPSGHSSGLRGLQARQTAIGGARGPGRTNRPPGGGSGRRSSGARLQPGLPVTGRAARHVGHGGCGPAAVDRPQGG